MNQILINKTTTQRPHIQLTVQRVEASEWKNLGFDKHHYLTADINKSCKCLLFSWNNTPVAFVGILNTPRRGMPNDLAISRLVILPDYQGLGLSSIILNFCGGIVKALGEDYRLLIKTIHTKMGKHLTLCDEWAPTAFNGKRRTNTQYEKGRYNNRLERTSYCFKYVGEAKHGYEELLLPINELRDKKCL
jgi:GNAT superfamily N-acetyltransferase